MEARIMKKSLISLILCGALSAAVLAGCAKPEAPAVDEAEASAIASQLEEILDKIKPFFSYLLNIPAPLDVNHTPQYDNACYTISSTVP